MVKTGILVSKRMKISKKSSISLTYLARPRSLTELLFLLLRKETSALLKKKFTSSSQAMDLMLYFQPEKGTETWLKKHFWK